MQLGREKLRKETMTQIAFAISDPTCNFSFTGGPRASRKLSVKLV